MLSLSYIIVFEQDSVDRIFRIMTTKRMNSSKNESQAKKKKVRIYSIFCFSLN